MEEVWKDVKGYEGIYQVSNLGRIWSYSRNKVLAQTKRKNGYMRVNLSKNSIAKSLLIHRLVAEAFIPNPNNLPCVNHKDENKTNNFVYVNTDGTVDIEKSNLEWCTIQYNNTYGTMQERSAKKRLGMKMPKDGIEKTALKHKKKIGMFKNGELVKVYDSAADANRENPNYNYISISACCNGRLKTYRGLEWKFINEVA